MKPFTSGQGFSTIPIAGLLAAVMFTSACGDDGREAGAASGGKTVTSEEALEWARTLECVK